MGEDSNAAAEDAAKQEEEEDDEDGTGEEDAKMAEFLKTVNPKSLVELSCAKLERSLGDARPGERFQFERNGYFVVDKYSKMGAPVFNRTVEMQKRGLEAKEDENKAARSRKDQQDKAKAV